MSFAATTALVAVFGGHAGQADFDQARPGLAAPGCWISAVLLAVGNFGSGDSAPVGAAHFNAISHYGLLANLLSVPVMGAVVDACRCIWHALFVPVGPRLDRSMQIMGVGLRWILEVGAFGRWAGWRAGSFVASGPGNYVLPMIALGAVFG